MNLTYGFFEAETVSIEGNGNLSAFFDFIGSRRLEEFVEDLGLSGVSNISTAVYTNFYANKFTMRKSPMEMLELIFIDVRNLVVADNPNLTTIWGRFWAPDVDSVTLLDNPKLLQASTTTGNWTERLSEEIGFVWPRKINNMVVRGAMPTEFL